MEKLKLCVDGASWCVIGATFMGYLPAIAAALAIIWNAIQIISWWKNRGDK
jgi:hypothetical protein